MVDFAAIVMLVNSGKVHMTFKLVVGEVQPPAKMIEEPWVVCGGGYISGQFITTSAEVTPNGGLGRESPPKWP